MESREIKRAIKDGWTVTLSDDPMHYLTVDLFGDLVVDSMRLEEGYPRKATLADKRRARLYRNNKQ